jgi:hypothetical protein
MMKVALVGTCPSSKMLAPYNDPSWEIWACSPDNAFGRIPRASAWFEIHGDLAWPESAEWGAPKYVEWLNQQTFPIYAIDRSVIHNAIPFPKDKMVETFGSFFFTSTFVWAFALALTKGADTIALYGIDMSASSEYAYQRPAMQHFIWLAAQTGVKVIAPDESDILQPPPLYGFSDATAMGRKLAVRERELQGRVNQLTRQRDLYNHDIAFLEGAIEDIDYLRKTWLGHANGEDGEIFREKTENMLSKSVSVINDGVIDDAIDSSSDTRI